MTIKEISILICGIVFLVIGILVSKHNKWKKFKTYIPILLGLFLVYISTVGPLSESKKIINEITKIDNTKVKSITFQPTRYIGFEKLSMYKQDSTVYDRNSINDICKRLRKSKIEGNRFLKNPKGVCRVIINYTNKKKICFGVRKSGKTTCITIDSDGEYGWHYANLNASDFGNILKSTK
jgi:hypothetical protein